MRLLGAFLQYSLAVGQPRLDSVLVLRKAINILQPHVEAIAAAVEMAVPWECPEHMSAWWEYMRKYTLNKPSQILQQLEESYERLAAMEGNAQQLLDNLEYDREDSEYCLASSLRSFMQDLKVLQYVIGKDGRKAAQQVVTSSTQMPRRKETEEEVKAREAIQEMSREDLQALLAQRLSCNQVHS